MIRRHVTGRCGTLGRGCAASLSEAHLLPTVTDQYSHTAASGAVRDHPDGVSCMRAKSHRRINRCCLIASQPPWLRMWPYVCLKHRKDAIR